MSALDPIDAFEDLLDRERRMILSGRVADLARLAEDKARILRDLGGLRDAGRLDRVAGLCRHNHDLLEAAAQGIRDVRDRLSDIRATAGTLATYSSDGKRQTTVTAKTSFERRA
jgi:flagellar biosynthesis/type III secretory pathway chaperone